MSNKLGSVCRRIAFGMFAVLLSLDFKFFNNSKKNPECGYVECAFTCFTQPTV